MRGRGDAPLVRHSKSAIHRAVAAGALDRLAALLREGDPDDVLGPVGRKPVDALDDANRCTPLHLAVMCDRMDVAAFLISEGADVNRPREDGVRDTPLTLAAKRGGARICFSLLLRCVGTLHGCARHAARGCAACARPNRCLDVKLRL